MGGKCQFKYLVIDIIDFDLWYHSLDSTTFMILHIILAMISEVTDIDYDNY